jgi:hypothetical protein
VEQFYLHAESFCDSPNVRLHGDSDSEDTPLSEEDKQELSRILLHRLTVIKAARRQLEELRRGAPQDEADEPGNKEP